MPAVIQGQPYGTLGPPPPLQKMMPAGPGSLMRGPPRTIPIPMAPYGTLPHPSMLRPPGFPPPPPGAPVSPLPPPQVVDISPPAPGGPPDPSFGKHLKSEISSNTSNMPKLGTHVPLAKCRVLYIGSAIPTETATGIEAVQQPLNDRYHTNGSGATNVPGIDGWLTAFSSGLLLQYVGDKSVITWFPIHTLHVSAAVKCVPQLSYTDERSCKFMSLDSPASKSSSHPPVFATIMRRTTGVKVLECHAFICKSEPAALALVQGTTHAYEHKEGWDEEPPPKELYQELEGNLNTADPEAEPDLPLFQPSETDIKDKPPIKGYFYNSKQELVRSYNVHHPSNSMMRPHPQLLKSVVPAPYPHPMPRPLPMLPGPRGAHSNPYLLPTAAPPVQYFEDWEAFRGEPIVVFPGPYMSQDEYKRTMREVRKKRKPRSNHHQQQVTMERLHRRREQDRIYERERALLERERTYQRPPPAHYESRYRDPAPIDFMDDMGNRYYQGHENDYGYGYREELPRAVERMDYIDDPDMVLYAPRYMRHIEGERDHHRTHDHTSGRPRHSDRHHNEPRYPRNDRGFSNSIAEERRLIGENGHADPYKMNDYRSREDVEMFRAGGGYGDLTRNLGYLP